MAGVSVVPTSAVEIVSRGAAAGTGVVRVTGCGGAGAAPRSGSGEAGTGVVEPALSAPAGDDGPGAVGRGAASTGAFGFGATTSRGALCAGRGAASGLAGRG